MPSSTTLLQACNYVFLNVNERTLANLSTLPGQQVRNAIREALFDISTDSDWSWLYSRINASSWSGGNTAYLPTNTQKIISMSWATNDGNLIPIPHVVRSIFDQTAPHSYTSNNRPTQWTQISDNAVQVNPYPTVSSEQDRIWFYIQRWVQLPSEDNGVFDMPEPFIDLLIKRATAIYALSHMEDGDLAAAYDNKYRYALSMARTRQLKAPQYSLNMYKGYRGYYATKTK